MLALMAARPLRLKNFAGLELGRHFIPTENNWLIAIPAEETKTKQPIAFDLPEMLLPWLERYLSEVRVLFPGAAESTRVWMGKDGVLTDQRIAWRPHHQTDAAPLRHIDQSASAA